MERLKKLIDLCRFYKIDTRQTYDRRNYDIEKDSIPITSVPDSVKARFPKQANYRNQEYDLLTKTKQVLFSSWYEDYHNRNAHDIQETLIDLTEEEFREMIKSEEGYFESFLKDELREIILQELVEARFHKIMNAANFG
jgi:hypothetical protein